MEMRKGTPHPAGPPGAGTYQDWRPWLEGSWHVRRRQFHAFTWALCRHTCARLRGSSRCIRAHSDRRSSARTTATDCWCWQDGARRALRGRRAWRDDYHLRQRDGRRSGGRGTATCAINPDNTRRSTERTLKPNQGDRRDYCERGAPLHDRRAARGAVASAAIMVRGGMVGRRVLDRRRRVLNGHVRRVRGIAVVRRRICGPMTIGNAGRRHRGVPRRGTRIFQ